MNELATQGNPFALSTMQDVRDFAKDIADSGCFGISKPAQAVTLIFLAREEGKTLAQLLKEVHVFDTGKLSQRADYTQAMFQRNGTILWHLRTNECVAGSFFAFKPIDDEARKRACERFELQYELDIIQMQPERDRARESELMLGLSKLARENEATVIRTLADAEAKGITAGKSGTKNNWAAGAISMLQWRCVTDAVKLIDPSIMSGLSSDVDLQDARAVEIVQREAFVKSALEPNSRDKEAMQSILDSHLQNAKDAKTDEERKHYQGLAAEMRCRIADLDITQVESEPKPELSVIDATTAEVEPPSKEKSEPQKPTGDWKDIVIHKGSANGPLLGKTLGEIFADGSLSKAKSLRDSIQKNFVQPCNEITDKGGKLSEKDEALLIGLASAFEHLAKREQGESGK